MSIIPKRQLNRQRIAWRAAMGIEIVDAFARQVAERLVDVALETVRKVIIMFLEELLMRLEREAIRLVVEAQVALLESLKEGFSPENLAEWIIDALRNGVPAVISRVWNTVRNFCHNNQQLMKTLAKISFQVFVKTFAREALQFSAKAIAREGMIQGARLVTAGANPILYSADVVQAVLELVGHKNTGKVVGAGGSILIGAIGGGGAAGPPGAVIGATFAAGVWFFGEVTGMVLEKLGL